MISRMAAVKGRTRRPRGESPAVQVSVFARIDPDIRKALDRAAAALGIGIGAYLEELVRHVQQDETPDGLPSWVAARVEARQKEALQLELRDSA